ncbi:hypothetical protein M8C21_020207 [Ambrosia artemisiifolia]|uniref:Uncharacterized protein n=1 Tax=Ambrosia artemisiifolia TaxID=4212 RepID=A0AAD5BP42_AMBAR|nr:hypothetical protein M8C21_020207 [Ambrosia artemisiifolia]
MDPVMAQYSIPPNVHTMIAYASECRPFHYFHLALFTVQRQVTSPPRLTPHDG